MAGKAAKREKKSRSRDVTVGAFETYDRRNVLPRIDPEQAASRVPTCSCVQRFDNDIKTRADFGLLWHERYSAVTCMWDPWVAAFQTTTNQDPSIYTLF
eukprot:scaffold1659_cov255-Pinguiococcus_pyrenoidosus.AAC.36